MIKFLLILLFLVPFSQKYELTQLRSLYDLAAEERSAAKELLEITADYPVEDPVLFGYKGAAHMMMAKHVINPISKMSHFNKGKEIFAQAIKRAPGNLELRFLRFAVQSEAPGFLGYKENMEEDKKLLVTGAGNIDNTQLQNMILDYLLSSEEISGMEKKKLMKNTH